MSFRNNRRVSNNRSSRNRLSLLNPSRLPKSIRDELRMCCALRGYSKIRQGDGKTLLQQHASMQKFFHGELGKSPSQVKMLAEGTSHYQDLYESGVVSMVTKKDSKRKKKQDVTRRHLRINLSRDETTLYYVGSEITYGDLEKKNRQGNEVLNGRQLTDMAKKGLREYRKALAFANMKWNMIKNEPKESGTTVEDVIEFVRCQMYLKDHVDLEGDVDSDRVVEGSIKKKRNLTLPKKVMAIQSISPSTLQKDRRRKQSRLDRPKKKPRALQTRIRIRVKSQIVNVLQVMTLVMTMLMKIFIKKMVILVIHATKMRTAMMTKCHLISYFHLSWHSSFGVRSSKNINNSHSFC